MSEDLKKQKEIYFPSYSGHDDNLMFLLKKTSQIICNWFAAAEKSGPLNFDKNFKYLMPDEKETSAEDLFSEIEILMANAFNPVNPGSLAHLDPPPLIFSILGELISASLNNNLLAYELSPSITLLEESLFRWFSEKIGFTSYSGGIAASGGTLSNLNALIAARFTAGLASDPNAVFLISEDAHSSFLKFTKIMGLPENNLIKVKTDIKGCMDVESLITTINQCLLDNKKIFSIVATIGTTIRGAIDPVKRISEICKENNIWLHIDGSIGGIFAISNFPIDGLDYIKYANSITINPQKILGITKTSSFLLVSDSDTLKKTFSTGLPYFSTNSNNIDRGELGIQGSRPAEVIKLWLGLRSLGINGINNILGSAIKRKEFFEKNLNSNKFEIYSGPLHIISLLPKNMDKKQSEIWTEKKRLELLNDNFMLSRPKFNGKYFLKIVMGNYNTSDSHLLDVLRILDN